MYYNWLSLPALVAASALAALFALELSLRRAIVTIPSVHLTRRSLSAGLAVLVSLWVLQIYLAVSQHKSELLNPRGTLYSLIVR